MSTWWSSVPSLAQRASENVKLYRETRAKLFEKYIAFIIKAVDERILQVALTNGVTSCDFSIPEFKFDSAFEPNLDELDIVILKLKEHLMKEDFNTNVSGSKFHVKWNDPEPKPVEKKNIIAESTSAPSVVTEVIKVVEEVAAEVVEVAEVVEEVATEVMEVSEVVEEVLEKPVTILPPLPPRPVSISKNNTRRGRKGVRKFY